MMRCFVTIAGILAVAGSVFASGAAFGASTLINAVGPNSVTATVNFDSPSFEVRGDATVVSIQNLLNTMDAGLPSLPVQTLKIALPDGAVLDRADVVPTSAAQTIKGTAKRAPAMMPISWHGKIPADKHLELAAAPDFTGATYPASRVATSVQYLHGVPVVITNVFPVTVNRANDGRETLSMITGAKVVLTYHVNPETALRQRPLFKHEAKDVADFVDNAADLATLNAAVTENSVADTYDYLVVTSDAFKAYAGQWNLNDLVNGLAGRGLKARVVTIGEATSGQAGADTQAKLRSYVTAQYQASGIRYLLLAADGDGSGAGAVIPARSMWSRVHAYDGSWTWVEENIPADLYYGNLDGTFNDNGNDKWGEITDGPGGTDVDLLAEVTVGRMPMKTTAELANFVRKTLWVGSNTMPKKTLLMGEELFSELNLYGDDYMNQLVGQCTDHNFSTGGYTPDWTEDKLYDRTGSWSGSQALSKINSGNYAMVNHLGHSNETYNMRMSSMFGAPAFANSNPFFFYTQGCFPGNFTYNDSFVELMVRHSNGPFAAIANTCYGLAPEDPDAGTTTTPGGSQMLHRRFIDAIFSQGVAELGRAHYKSKEAFIGMATAQEIRWVTWDANFFGDPSVAMHY